MSNSQSAARMLEAKQKRQKKILAVTSVIFLAVVGFQLPRIMGGGGGASAEPAVPATPDQQLAVAPSAALPDTDRVSVTAGSGQLISFGLFKSKDPFVQQLTTVPSTGTETPATETPVTPAATTPTSIPPVTPAVTPSSAAPRSTAPNGGLTPVTTPSPSSTVPFPATTPVSPAPSGVTPADTTPTSASPTPATSAAAHTSVSISTNGLCEVVNVNGTFPSTEDIFRVISIAKDGKSAKVGVVGGAYDSGAASVTLKLGQKLTLVNTADGSRYVLLLKSKCDVPTQAATAGTATAPTSAVAPPAGTTTATTPIVTDPLDSSAFGTGTGP